MAFVTATPILARTAFTPAVSPARRGRVAATPRPIARVTMAKEDMPKPEKIPQGFTNFSENLNGRVAMFGFALGLVTELITGKGIVAQVGSIFEIVQMASALTN